MTINNLRSSKLRRTLLVAAALSPVAVVLATGGAVSAKKIILTPASATYECQNSDTSEAPFIVATAPVLDNEPATEVDPLAGPQVRVLVFQGNVSAAFLDGTLTDEPFATGANNISDGESIEIEVPRGLYTVAFDMPKFYKDASPEADPDWKLDVVDTVYVSCGGGNPDFNFDLNVSVKPLPKTGAGLDPALVLAPIAVLAGAALIMVRRRLATV